VISRSTTLAAEIKAPALAAGASAVLLLAGSQPAKVMAVNPANAMAAAKGRAIAVHVCVCFMLIPVVVKFL
jgi:hypothetical protein